MRKAQAIAENRRVPPNSPLPTKRCLFARPRVVQAGAKRLAVFHHINPIYTSWTGLRALSKRPSVVEASHS